MKNNNLSITIIDAIKNIVSSTESEVEYDVKPLFETKGVFKSKPIAKITTITIKIRELV
jgi:hypothetical protein